MFGALIGSIGGGLVNGLMDNIMGGNKGGGGLLGGLMDNIMGGGQGGGLLGGLGDIAGKLLDPLGLFSGKQEQSAVPDEVKDLLGDIKELLGQLLEKFSSQENPAEKADQASDGVPAPGGPIHIDGGSGDDVITIGQPVAAS